MDLEHQKETDLNTYLISTCLSRDRTVADAFEGTPAYEKSLPRSFPPAAVPSPSGVANWGSGYSRSTQRRWASPSCSEVVMVTCPKACFRCNKEKHRGFPNSCTRSSEVPTVETMALGRGSWASETESGILLQLTIPRQSCLG